MSKSTGSRASRKAPKKPKKPYAEFPLTPHASGKWQKKIRGQIYYFGAWMTRVAGVPTSTEGGGWKAALAEYKKVADDLRAGRTPRVATDGLSVADLCNHFRAAKLRQVEARELTNRMFQEYATILELINSTFGGKGRLAADDFARLREIMAHRWGPLRVLNGVTRVKTVFKYGYESGLMDRLPRYGVEFKPPSAGALRRHKAKAGPKMFEADELRAMIDGKVIEGEGGSELVFLTYRGTRWVRLGEKSRSDYVSQAFNRLLKRLKFSRSGCGFYTLRHVSRTIADGARDIPAVRTIMGHVDSGIDATYRERMDDSRLRAVADHVRKWLWPDAAPVAGEAK